MSFDVFRHQFVEAHGFVIEKLRDAIFGEGLQHTLHFLSLAEMLEQIGVGNRLCALGHELDEFLHSLVHFDDALYLLDLVCVQLVALLAVEALQAGLELGDCLSLLLKF